MRTLKALRLAAISFVLIFTCTLMQPLYQVAAQEAPAEEAETPEETTEDPATPPPPVEEAPNDQRAIDLDAEWFKTYSGEQCGPGAGTGNAPENIPQAWRDLIWGAAPKYPNVDPRMVAAVLWVENRGWPEYKVDGWAESSAAARGPFQFIPQTWFGQPNGNWGMDYRDESNYASNAMGTDGDGDDIRDPNNPKDAVEAALKHHEGSAGDPISEEGFDASKTPEENFETVVLRRKDGNLLFYAAKYNGSGAPDGVRLKEFTRGQNSDYVIMSYWLLVTNFEKGFEPNTGEFVDAETSGNDTGENSGSGSAGSMAIGTCGTGGSTGPLAPGGLSWPNKVEGSAISACFGEPRDKGPHGGMDISAPADVPAYASAAGEVVFSGYADGYGDNFVSIKHQGDDGEYFTSYGHMNSKKVAVGDQVTQGQEIGTIGSQGFSTAPHMHFNLSLKSGDKFNGDSDPLRHGMEIPAGVPNGDECPKYPDF